MPSLRPPTRFSSAQAATASTSSPTCPKTPAGRTRTARCPGRPLCKPPFRALKAPFVSLQSQR
eukprot:3446246-Rhodomonas_salina.1